uniref:Uncharacterized protein n=1 Tax=Sus scrofa TaxID=9823 RepID=A0A8D1YSR0_PIG
EGHGQAQGEGAVEETKGRFCSYNSNKNNKILRLQTRLGSRVAVALAKIQRCPKAERDSRLEIVECLGGRPIYVPKRWGRRLLTKTLSSLVMSLAVASGCSLSLTGLLHYTLFSEQFSKQHRAAGVISKKALSLVCAIGLEENIIFFLHEKEKMSMFYIPVDRLRALPFLFFFIHEEELPLLRGSGKKRKSPTNSKHRHTFARRETEQTVVAEGEGRDGMDSTDGRTAPPESVRFAPSGRPSTRVPSELPKPKPALQSGDQGWLTSQVIFDLILLEDGIRARSSFPKERRSKKSFSTTSEGFLTSESPKVTAENYSLRSSCCGSRNTLPGMFLAGKQMFYRPVRLP